MSKLSNIFNDKGKIVNPEKFKALSDSISDSISRVGIKALKNIEPGSSGDHYFDDILRQYLSSFDLLEFYLSNHGVDLI